jgi:hypothetical protein
MPPIIRQICEVDIDSFHEAVDLVARERTCHSLTQAPPLTDMQAMVRGTID